MQPRDVLENWFGTDGHPHEVRDFWFRESAATYSKIRNRFGTSIELAPGGALEN